jgi:hypothetical protein
VKISARASMILQAAAQNVYVLFQSETLSFLLISKYATNLAIESRERISDTLMQPNRCAAPPRFTFVFSGSFSAWDRETGKIHTRSLIVCRQLSLHILTFYFFSIYNYTKSNTYLNRTLYFEKEISEFFVDFQKPQHPQHSEFDGKEDGKILSIQSVGCENNVVQIANRLI